MFIFTRSNRTQLCFQMFSCTTGRQLYFQKFTFIHNAIIDYVFKCLLLLSTPGFNLFSSFFITLKSQLCFQKFPCRNIDCSTVVDNFTCPEPEHMHKCSNNRCIYRRWLCDGEDDCRNGEDEIPENCYRTSTIFKCLYFYLFICFIIIFDFKSLIFFIIIILI